MHGQMHEDMIDSIYDDYYDSKREDALEVRNKLLEMSDQDFLELILMQPANLYEHPRTSLNNVIPAFPAGDIAVKHRDERLALSRKQKMALANVYVFVHLNVRLRGY